MVSILAFYSNVPSLNPAEVNSYYSVNCLKRKKIAKKRPGTGHFSKKTFTRVFLPIRFSILIR